MERLLGVSFPSPRAAWKEEEEMCIICYNYRHPLDAYVPDVVCSNAKCSRPMHRDCLVQVQPPVISPSLPSPLSPLSA